METQSLMTEIKALLEKNINDSHVEVSDLTGTGDHLGLLVVSPEFEGKMLIKQHQIVMDLLKESFKVNLHAIQLKTLTPDKYNK